jgi:hypothetical protein
VRREQEQERTVVIKLSSKETQQKVKSVPSQSCFASFLTVAVAVALVCLGARDEGKENFSQIGKDVVGGSVDLFLRALCGQP